MTLVPAVGISDQYMSPLTLAQPQESGVGLKPFSPKRKGHRKPLWGTSLPCSRLFCSRLERALPLFCLSQCVIRLLASLLLDPFQVERVRAFTCGTEGCVKVIVLLVAARDPLVTGGKTPTIEVTLIPSHLCD